MFPDSCTSPVKVSLSRVSSFFNLRLRVVFTTLLQLWSDVITRIKPIQPCSAFKSPRSDMNSSFLSLQPLMPVPDVCQWPLSCKNIWEAQLYLWVCHRPLHPSSERFYPPTPLFLVCKLFWVRSNRSAGLRGRQADVRCRTWWCSHSGQIKQKTEEATHG